MSTQSRVFDPHHGLTHAVVVLPFILIVIAALALSVASVAAKGAANEFGYPSWLPTLGGLVVSLPLTVSAPLLAWLTWRRTNQPFRIARVYLVLALIFFAACLSLTLIYAWTIADPTHYRSDERDPITGAFKPLFDADSFRDLSVMLGAFISVILLIVPTRFLYWSAFPPAMRDEVEGRDPMGEIMRSTHS
jgi:hypothetical protein